MSTPDKNQDMKEKRTMAEVVASAPTFEKKMVKAKAPSRGRIVLKEPTNADRNLMCRFFNTPQGCRFGAECKFVHSRVCIYFPECHAADKCPYLHFDKKKDVLVRCRGSGSPCANLALKTDPTCKTCKQQAQAAERMTCRYCNTFLVDYMCPQCSKPCQNANTDMQCEGRTYQTFCNRCWAEVNKCDQCGAPKKKGKCYKCDMHLCFNCGEVETVLPYCQGCYSAYHAEDGDYHDEGQDPSLSPHSPEHFPPLVSPAMQVQYAHQQVRPNMLITSSPHHPQHQHPQHPQHPQHSNQPQMMVVAPQMQMAGQPINPWMAYGNPFVPHHHPGQIYVVPPEDDYVEDQDGVDGDQIDGDGDQIDGDTVQVDGDGDQIDGDTVQIDVNEVKEVKEPKVPTSADLHSQKSELEITKVPMPPSATHQPQPSDHKTELPKEVGKVTITQGSPASPTSHSPSRDLVVKIIPVGAQAATIPAVSRYCISLEVNPDAIEKGSVIRVPLDDKIVFTLTAAE